MKAPNQTHVMSPVQAVEVRFSETKKTEAPSLRFFRIDRKGLTLTECSLTTILSFLDGQSTLS